MRIMGKFNTSRGASLSSYGLVVGLISIVALGATTNVGGNVDQLFTQVADTTQQVVDDNVSFPSPSASPSASASPSPACSAPDEVYDSAGQHTVTVPSNCTNMTVHAWGSGGGGGNNDNSTSLNVDGGGGAYVTGTFAVTPGETIYANVGGAGTYNSGLTWSCQSQKHNGGGAAGGRAGTGGGAADIRIGGSANANRVLVAAGGGGGGYIHNTAGFGGAGGLTTGFQGGAGYSSSSAGGAGGTQSAGGTAGNHVGNAPTAWGTCHGNGTGALAQGGSGSTCSGCLGGGGGGGYYGGGGGSAYNGAGGGSSLIPSGGSGEAGNNRLSGGQSVTERPTVNIGNGGTDAFSGYTGAIVIIWD